MESYENIVMNQTELKKAAAAAAIKFVKNSPILGVGTGSTTNHFIAELAKIKHRIDGVVASSKQTEKELKKYNIPLIELNSVTEIPVYVDGADEFNDHGYLIKGGGGALVREKIVAAASKQFICIVDQTKQVNVLGEFPLPVEVIPMARSFVARELLKLAGDPEYRSGFVSDNGNVILDVHRCDLTDPIKMEATINNIPGVVGNGIFAHQAADVILVATDSGIDVRTVSK